MLLIKGDDLKGVKNLLDILIKLITLMIFAVCYGLAILRRFRLACIALTSAFLLLALLIPTNTMTPRQAWDSVKWDVLGIYWGFMMLSIVFAGSGAPEYLARHVLRKTKNEGKALLVLCGISALLSSFLENVGVVLIMAPIAVEVAKKTKSSLFPYLVSIAVCSNMVTTVTMVADPPAIILASEAKMSFLDFYWFQGKIGLGIISIIGAVVGLAALYLVHFRKMKKVVEIKEEKIRINYAPTVLLVGGVVALALNSYIGVGPGIIGLAIGIIALILSRKNVEKMITEFDWDSFFFIFGIFIVIGSVSAVGLLDDLARAIGGLGLSNHIITLAVLVWISVLLSSFIDNVPYTVLMIPVVQGMAKYMGIDPMNPIVYGWLFGMLIGTGIGGNLTPVGASANVFAAGLLEKRGYRVKLKDYMKIGLPATIASVLTAHLLLQLLWIS